MVQDRDRDFFNSPILLSGKCDQDVIPAIDNLILALSEVTSKINEKQEEEYAQ